MSATLLTPAVLGAMPLPEPPADGDKSDRGVVLVVAGGAQLPGVPILTGRSALRVGAGKLRLAAGPDLAVPLGVAVPEARVFATPTTAQGDVSSDAAEALKTALHGAAAVIVGPGMIDAPNARALTERLLRLNARAGFVIDAGALPASGRPAGFAALAAGRAVLTPHAGEMAHMLGLTRDAVLADPRTTAREAAARLQAIVVLKGATTHVATPSGTAWRHDGGVAGLATSGSGDVLSGVIGGLLARGAPPATAALWGVALHAAAGRRLAEAIGPVGFLASDLLAALPKALTELTQASAGMDPG